MSDGPIIKSRATVVVMTAGGANPAIVINALQARWSDLHVIQERPESKLEIWRRRARRLGSLQATGQLATMIASRLLKKAANRRMTEICRQYDVSTTLDPQSRCIMSGPSTTPKRWIISARCRRLSWCWSPPAC